MAGFEISTIENSQIGNWNFEVLKAGFEAALKEYSTRVYTDEATAKADKAELNKVKKIIEDKRKEYKNQCLAPYQAAEKQIKQLVALVDIEQERITASLTNFENDRKAKKETEIREFYDTKSAPLGENASRMFKKILNKSWLNESTQRKKWESEIVLAIASAAEDIRQLNSINTPYVGTLIDLYIGGMSLAECIRKNEEYIGVNTSANAVSEEKSSVPAMPVQHIKSDTTEDGVTVRIHGSQRQMEQVFDFMKAVGINFEIV